MRLLDSKHQRAAVLILILGIALAIALMPFATGLIGIPVLYVIFTPVYRALAPRVKPTLAAALTVALALLVVVLLLIVLTVVIVNQAPGIARGLIQSPLRDRLAEIRIGDFQVGPRLAGLEEQVVNWLGTSAIGLIGTATRLTLNLIISFFGLFYLLLGAEPIWAVIEPYIPFSTPNSELLRGRFKLITTSTFIGTGLGAVIQGILLGIAFWVAGFPDVLFWSVVTVIVAIFPIVGSGLIWVPAVAVLLLNDRYVAAIAMAVWGLIVVSNVDHVIRPMVFRRYAKIHPLLTLVGAFAGIRYFGLLGLLVGPLALSYFFELIRMYKEEYLRPRAGPVRRTEGERRGTG
jgi:predicted PurR-regulated permease PerM